ncbi:MAG: class I SAM-dependent methyltransferase [Dehalococcoidales bacterium]|nr:class I SAM-dependent methyltransferase [Dehalococcoidales bacterium]
MSTKNSESIAQRWEDIYQSTSLNELPWEEGKPSTQLVELIESGAVEKGAALDVCCGSGNNAIFLAAKGFFCYGIDISPTAIGYAREKAAAEGKKCDLITGNVLRLPYLDNTFTLVFDRGCFHSIQPSERRAYAHSIFRVLKPSGMCLLECFSAKDHVYGPPYGFSAEDIEHYFSELFKINHIKEFSTGKNGADRHFLAVFMEKPPYKEKTVKVQYPVESRIYGMISV